MSDNDHREPSAADKLFGDFAPALVGYTDDVLFGDVWKRPQLSPRDRSLITVAALTTLGNTDQLLSATTRFAQPDASQTIFVLGPNFEAGQQ